MAQLLNIQPGDQHPDVLLFDDTAPDVPHKFDKTGFPGTHWLSFLDDTGANFQDANGTWWPSIEHYFGGQKAFRPADKQHFMHPSTYSSSHAAKRAHRIVHMGPKSKLQAWQNGRNIETLLAGLRLRSDQDPAFKAKLLSTTGKLCEQTYGEYGNLGGGANVAGRCCMVERRRLRIEALTQHEESGGGGHTPPAQATEAKAQATAVQALTATSATATPTTQQSEAQRRRRDRPPPAQSTRRRSATATTPQLEANHGQIAISVGEKVTVVGEEQGGWYKIETNGGTTGWIPTASVDITRRAVVTGVQLAGEHGQMPLMPGTLVSVHGAPNQHWVRVSTAANSNGWTPEANVLHLAE